MIQDSSWQEPVVPVDAYERDRFGRREHVREHVRRFPRT